MDFYPKAVFPRRTMNRAGVSVMDAAFLLVGIDSPDFDVISAFLKSEHGQKELPEALESLELAIGMGELVAKPIVTTKQRRSLEELSRAIAPTLARTGQELALPESSTRYVLPTALKQWWLSKNRASGVQPELGKRERETLLKLVIGMAVAGYKHVPGAARSHAPSEIASDLLRLGLAVSDDTVRTWLKVAAEAVMPTNPPKT